eukprot:4308167-Prorocentrum_lima.AAC.1
MTSSLVGSEMCIRDRHEKEDERGREEREVTRGGRQTAKCKRAPWSKAVSYTHLTLPTICSV